MESGIQYYLFNNFSVVANKSFSSHLFFWLVHSIVTYTRPMEKLQNKHASVNNRAKVNVLTL